MATLLRILGGTAGLVLCALAAMLINGLLARLGVTPVAGRQTLVPALGLFALIVLLFTHVLRRRLHWGLGALGGMVLAANGLMLAIVGYFSGRQGLTPFNLEWLLFLNLFVTLPMAAAVAVEALKRRDGESDL